MCCLCSFVSMGEKIEFLFYKNYKLLNPLKTADQGCNKWLIVEIANIHASDTSLFLFHRMYNQTGSIMAIA